MSIKELTIDLLLETVEGYESIAYQDSGGIWTIGFGTVFYPDGQHVQKGDTCTKCQAIEYLNYHLGRFIYPAIEKAFPLTLIPDNVYAALSSFLYNEGIEILKKPDLTHAVEQQDWKRLADVMRKYDKVRIDGKLTTVEGLEKRREKEIAYFLGK